MPKIREFDRHKIYFFASALGHFSKGNPANKLDTQDVVFKTIIKKFDESG